MTSLRVARKGMGIGILFTMILIFLTFAVVALLYFAQFFPQVAHVLSDAGIINISDDLSAPKELDFDIAPAARDEARARLLGQNFHYQVAFSGEFAIRGFLARNRIFRVEKVFPDRETPTEEGALKPTAQEIAQADRVPESDIMQIDSVSLGRITLWYDSPEGQKHIDATFIPKDEESTLLSIPYTFASGQTKQVPMAELHYLGLTGDLRGIRYRVVPAYDVQAVAEGTENEQAQR